MTGAAGGPTPARGRSPEQGRGPSIVAIDDPAEPRVAPFIDVRERDLVGRGGQFMAEGEVVLCLLADRAPHLLRAVLVVERRLQKLAPLLARLPRTVPVYAARQPVVDRIAGLHLNRGILALGDKPVPPSLEACLAALPERGAIPILVGLSNHDNVGGVFRNAAAFGAPFVVIDGKTADPFYRKAVRVSVGASVTVPTVRAEKVSSVLDQLVAAGVAPLALTPHPDAEDIFQMERPSRVAVLLGTEGEGLPDEILARCQAVRIPMAAGFDSLNVSVAAGIALAVLSRGS